MNVIAFISIWLLFVVNMECRKQKSCTCHREFDTLKNELLALKNELLALKNELLARIPPAEEEPERAITDCYDVLHIGGGTTSGVYTVRLRKTGRQVRVYCDMTADGGGWTVFQNRFNGSVDFYKNFLQYEQGFGNLEAEFWLGGDDFWTYNAPPHAPPKVQLMNPNCHPRQNGNEGFFLRYKVICGLTYIEELTYKSENELRLHLEAADGTTAQRNFQQFWLSAAPNYNLHITRVQGDNESVGLISNNGYQFTTYDNDRDFGTQNCGVVDHGGWWYRRCTYSNLNGEYVTPGTISPRNRGEGGITYRSFKGYESLKSTKMMLRRA